MRFRIAVFLVALAGCLVTANRALARAHEARLQGSLGEWMEADKDGLYTLREDGVFVFLFVAENRCSWPQPISAWIWGDRVLSETVEPGTVPWVFDVRRRAGGDVQTYNLRFEHEETRQGDAICHQSSEAVTIRIRWVTGPAAAGLPAIGKLNRTDKRLVFNTILVLKQTDTTPPAPPAAQPPAPPPAAQVAVADGLPIFTVPNSAGQPVDLNPFDADLNPFDPDAPGAPEPTVLIDEPAPAPPADPPASSPLVTTATNSSPREPVPSFVPLGDPLGVADGVAVPASSTTLTVSLTPVEPAPGVTVGASPPPSATPNPPASPTPSNDAPTPQLEDIAGMFVVRDGGTYTVSATVTNQCDWQQPFNLTWRVVPTTGASPYEIADSGSVAAKGSTTMRYRVEGRDRPISITAAVSHAPQTQGNKICENVNAGSTVHLRWVGADPSILGAGTILTPDEIVIPQREVPVETPTTVTRTTPDPPASFIDDIDDVACADGGCMDIGACTGGSCGIDPPLIPEPPGGLDSRYQIMGGELEPLRVNASGSMAFLQPPPQMASRRLNPLGLLAKSIGEFLEWWSPTVHAAETLTLEQASRVPGGLQFLVSSLGGSTGKTLSMQVLNFTGKPINLQGMLALEPLKADAQQRVTQAFSTLAGKALPARVDLRGYCFEFLKLPPIAGQLMTVAAPAAQKRFEPLKRVMTAANRLKRTGQLRPDSAPDAYGDSIKQWAIWTMEQKFSQNRFAEAFLSHTRKNVEASGQKWTKQIEDVVRQRTPNRWQDIVAILKGAGAAIPQ
jgi:hypothetical protein